MKHKFKLLTPLLLVMVVILSACSSGEGEAEATNEDSGKIQVVATIGMIADVAANIGGEQVEVTTLMGAGVDPHLYSATERDVETLLEAEIILYNGLHLEARMADVLEQLSEDGGIVGVAVGEALPEDMVEQAIGLETPDPHIWMDVTRWTIIAEEIRDTFIEYDPDNQEIYQANADAYIAELDELNEYVKTSIESIPEQQRRLVTAHDAFQYYSLAYGIEVFAPQGISTESEASVADIQDSIDYVVEYEVPAIFFESSVSPDTVEAILEGARSAGVEVEIGGELFSDAMGEEGTFEGTYIGMIQTNTETIVTALGGTPAE